MKFEDVISKESTPRKVLTISEELEMFKAKQLDEAKAEICPDCDSPMKDGKCAKCAMKSEAVKEGKCAKCGGPMKDGKCPKDGGTEVTDETPVEEGCDPKGKKGKNPFAKKGDEEVDEGENPFAKKEKGDEKESDDEDEKEVDEKKKPFKKKEVKEAVINEAVDVANIIKVLGDTDWHKDNESQMKAVQLLKGIALSDDPKANAFMTKLSNASTSIAKSVVGGGEEKKTDESVVAESTSSYANELLDGAHSTGPQTRQSANATQANDLM